jgi:predicted nucleotidyltransferase
MFNFRAMVRVLAQHEVEFAIVGGLAGVMQGAPLHTQDLDILYSLEPPNPTRLLDALLELDAFFSDDPRRIRPNLSHMESRGHKLLATRHGRVDCLATIEENTAFEDVLADTDWMELDGIPVRVLSLPRLIEVKRKLSRPKDQLALLQLRATLEEREKQG